MDAISDSLGALPDALTFHKHIPQASGKTSRRTRNHIIRATAKRQARGEQPSRRSLATVPLSFLSDAGPESLAPDARRAQIENDVRCEFAEREGLSLPLPQHQRPHPGRTLRAWASHEAEGRDLARSGVPLPSDHSQLVRRRSLERQDAFCDADTFKGNVHLRRSASASDDAQVAELYHMGLLYDSDADAAHEPFSLNSIQHEEPVYSIRPAKRARKLNKARGYDMEQPLDLDLSFADLGTDEAIAHYLMSPSLTETEDNDTSADDAIQHEGRQAAHSFAPLRVIYELVSSRPSFDVDTSQPPDLVNDILSDYDCFSDSELDDVPAQRELHEDADSGSSSSNTSGGSDAAATDARADPWVILG